MKLSRLAIYAWGVLVCNLLVILWGAYVRATGSGAGCGQHWPLCNGEAIPRTPPVETMIEFSHRLSSGLALVLVLGLGIWVFRAYAKGHLARRAAGFSILFIMTEALVGAGLVLFELVADDASLARAIVMALHLINTFLLLGALTLTAWWSSGGRPVRLKGRVGWLLGIGLGGMLILGASGGVTALGDTLFPARSLAEGLQQDVSPTAHFLIRLRLLHPLIAIAVGIYLMITGAVSARLRPGAVTKRLARLLTVLYLVQLGAGAFNVALQAPVWLQLVHLWLSDLIWITLVLLASSALARPAPAETDEAAARTEDKKVWPGAP
ncbi:MAG: COX15/CtaA family protein, partial [Chloroflexota bacterium]